MSAYALPGLFPPISDVSAKTEASNETIGTSSVDTNSTATQLSMGPLHDPQMKSSLGITNMLKASVDRFYLPSLGSSCSDEKAQTADCSETKDENEYPGIAVKEAKIDPVRLVQCVTGSLRKQQQQQKRKLRGRGSSERLDSVQNSPVGRKALKEISFEVETEERESKGTPHDEAIEFELSISFNGRKYTATRTLQCIVQLRDDLIREMNHRKRWLRNRSVASHPSQDDVVPDSSPVADEDTLNIHIPEIPPMTGDESAFPGAGFVGRGFSMLHAMATSYVPVVERWLRNVMAIVPQDSECLSKFLWEPRSSELSLDFNGIRLSSNSCTSLAALGSIKELEYNTEDDDSDDEW